MSKLLSIIIVLTAASSMVWADQAPSATTAALKVKELIGNYTGTAKAEDGSIYKIDLQVATANCNGKCVAEKPPISATSTIWVRDDKTMTFGYQFQGIYDVAKGQLVLHDPNYIYDDGKLDIELLLDVTHNSNGAETLDGYLMTGKVGLINVTKVN